jgi:hypothetical protein
MRRLTCSLHCRIAEAAAVVNNIPCHLRDKYTKHMRVAAHVACLRLHASKVASTGSSFLLCCWQLHCDRQS